MVDLIAIAVSIADKVFRNVILFLFWHALLIGDVQVLRLG